MGLTKTPEERNATLERAVFSEVYQIISKRFAGSHYDLGAVSKEVAKAAIAETKRHLSSWKL